jgi:hypothetical protein
MVAAGSNYTVASIGSAAARRLEVLRDPVAGAAGVFGLRRSRRTAPVLRG